MQGFSGHRASGASFLSISLDAAAMLDIPAACTIESWRPSLRRDSAKLPSESL